MRPELHESMVPKGSGGTAGCPASGAFVDHGDDLRLRVRSRHREGREVVLLGRDVLDGDEDVDDRFRCVSGHGGRDIRPTAFTFRCHAAIVPRPPHLRLATRRPCAVPAADWSGTAVASFLGNCPKGCASGDPRHERECSEVHVRRRRGVVVRGPRAGRGSRARRRGALGRCFLSCREFEWLRPSGHAGTARTTSPAAH